MKKSLMIVTEAFEIGGVETYIRTEIEELAGQGWEVHLVCGRNFLPTLVPDCVASVTSGLALGPEAGISDFLVAVDTLVEAGRVHAVTLIHAHPFTSNIAALAAAHVLRIPLFLTLHGPSSIAGTYGAVYDFMIGSMVLPSASVVLAVSEEVCDLARSYVSADRLRVQPNAVAPVEAETWGGGNGRWLLVSRLDQAKLGGIVEFVEVLLEMPGGAIDICGDGPERERIERQYAAAIEAGRLRMLGTSDSVQSLMCKYSGVAGMGRVAIEGMVQGLPVVLVGYDGVKGVLDDSLRERSSKSNYSGRGLPSVSRVELRNQLDALSGQATPIVNIQQVHRIHAPETVWGGFADLVAASAPVDMVIIGEFVGQLRAAHADSSASAYWSREVMDVLARIVAGGGQDNERLRAPLALLASSYTRGAIEQEVAHLRELIQMFGDAGDAGRRERVALTEDVLAQVSSLNDGFRAQVHEQARLAQASMVRMSALEVAVDGVLRHGEQARGLQISLAEQLSAARASLHDDLRIGIGENLGFLREEFGRQSLALADMFEGQKKAIAETEERVLKEMRRIETEIDRSDELCQEVEVLCDRIEALERELDDVYSSTSWILTRPMRLLKRMVTQPRSVLQAVRSELAVRDVGQPGLLRRSLNFARRTARTGRIDPSDRARLRSMVRNGYANVVENLGLPETLSRPVLSPGTGQADVFVWCVIDWHFRMQRPQHLAAAMAGKGHRVFYISNNFADSAAPGFTVEALDATGRLFQVNLNLKGSPQIYTDLASPAQVAAIRASLAELLAWTGTSRSISLIQHPYWIEPAQCLPNMQLVYDCMDHHGGFENNASSILAGEELLVRRSDLLIVTSQWLLDEMSSRSQSIALIRNATEYEHFANRPERVFVDAQGRKVIGYYGAIAEWFDVELLRKVALDHADALVVMVGRDTAGAQVRLKDVPNVIFVGEVPYAELPQWLYGFDVCLLPFQVIPLTLATNPVKVYEYLSAGKPVVSVDLPEMAQFQGLVELADSPEGFSAAVGRVLAGGDTQAALVPIRQEFAANQTWGHRAADLDAALAGIQEPRVSVIVLCYNNAEFTRACLDSLEKYSDYPNLELIAVDNASSDETPQMLAEWAAAAQNRIHIANSSNLGFSAGNNVGLAAATGDYLVILNNDTYVTPGWVRGLMRHLRRNPGAGLVGPVTNNIGNEARIEIGYSNMDEMIEAAGRYTRRHAGISFPMRTAAFFCVMITREAYTKTGPMDEAFGVGFFEDDDYCRRLEREGFGVICADDVFVHHHLSASFDKLKSQAKQALFDKNRALYEAKWDSWKPHQYRPRSD